MSLFIDIVLLSTQQEPTPAVTSERIVVIGAGIGGLAAAMLLAARGRDVLVLERQASPGGKMRLVRAGGAAINGGPTVFTLRSIFERLFDDAGASLPTELGLKPLDVLARHSWGHGPELDLFADLEESADAIGAFAGATDARGFRALQAEARHMFLTLEKTFIEAQRPSPIGVALGRGFSGLTDMMKINPFETLWGAVSRHLKDPRLRQLFGRYATYVGSSPFAAVATLLLIAHVEQEGVWSVDGGMHALARACERVLIRRGGTIRYDCEVRTIETGPNGVTAVIISNGERIPCTSVIVNADANAIATGLFGQDAARAVDPLPPATRSLSAITWCANIETTGFPLALHNVFFSNNYADEFTELKTGYPSDPTVYVCAQDRTGAVAGPERLLILVNAPAHGDRPEQDRERVERAMRTKLSDCGLSLTWDSRRVSVTPPQGFARFFPATGGALYGRASHGWMASFKRPGAATAIPGLYLAGGSVHPGAGVPMAALSGRHAAEALMAQTERKLQRSVMKIF